MLKRFSTTHSISAFAFLASLIICIPATAAPIMCAVDIDGNGDVSEAGESASCLAGGDGTDQLCPLDAVACDQIYPDACPVPGNTCVAGVCDTPASCELIDVFGENQYHCPTIIGADGNFGNDQAACDLACSTATQACDGPPPSFECPIDSTIGCVNNAGIQQCSATACVDMALNTPVEQTLSGQGTLFVDDGVRNEDGVCEGITMIFSGRSMECRRAGSKTAWQNCCSSSGEIYTDSRGSSIEGTAVNTAVVMTAQIASAAFGAYASSISSGASVAAASNAASTAASNTFIAGFDPTSLAISIAVGLVVNYLTKACPQESMETAILNSSGYCIETGEYCQSDNVFGCSQRANTFCCFNSLLARIIHEQGRPQLSSFADGFGDHNNPDCRGFTPEEFQALDFSEIDLSEYYDNVSATSTEDIQATIQEGVDDAEAEL